MDAMMAFPFLILAVAVVAVIGSSITNVIAVISFLLIPRANRVARSITLSVREREYVEGARALGAGPLRIIFPHILPQTHVGLHRRAHPGGRPVDPRRGQPGVPGSRGTSPPPLVGPGVARRAGLLPECPHLVIYPGLAIALAVFAANIFGDALRDKLDPRSGSS